LAAFFSSAVCECFFEDNVFVFVATTAAAARRHPNHVFSLSCVRASKAALTPFFSLHQLLLLFAAGQGCQIFLDKMYQNGG
jgi:hypothetical protein